MSETYETQLRSASESGLYMMVGKGRRNVRTQTTPTPPRSGEVGATTSDENFVGEASAENQKIGSVEPPLDFIQRALTTRSEALSYRDPGSPPDRGTKAWLQGKSSPFIPQCSHQTHKQQFYKAT